MAKGTVKWFDPKKGFGFVVNEDGVDVFVHHSRILKDGFRCLRTGQVVEYNEIAGEKGLQGIDVLIIGDRTSEDVDSEAYVGEIA